MGCQHQQTTPHTNGALHHYRCNRFLARWKHPSGGGSRSTTHGSEIILWDVQSGELERSLKQPDEVLGTQILTIAFSPDGKRIVTGGGAGRSERINEISGHFNIQYGMAQVWNVKSDVFLMTLGTRVHRNLVSELAFSPDGTRLATGSLDHTVGLWDMQRGRLLGNATRYGIETEVKITETRAGTPGVQRTDTFEEGTGRVSSSSQVTGLTNPKALGTATITRTKVSVTGFGIQDLVFSNDGKILHILSNDKLVRAWDVASPSPQSDPLRRSIPSNNSSYSCLAFSPNSYWLVGGPREQGAFLEYG